MPGAVVDACRQLKLEFPETSVTLFVGVITDNATVGGVQAGADRRPLKGMADDRLASALRALAAGEMALAWATSEDDPPHQEVGDPPAELRGATVRQPPLGGWRTTRALLYVPRFARHFQRRIRSEIGVSLAWRTARDRMRDY